MAPGGSIESHRLTRTQFERWFVNRAVGLVVMEACGSAHHWARWLNGLGIEVRLLPAAYIRAYVKRNKTDAADACALLEAARCAEIVPVRVKSIEQQALQGLHRTRSLWMGTRTSRINALRGFCREFGIVIAQGSRLGVEQISRVLADPHAAVPTLIRGTMTLAGRGNPSAGGAHRAARTRVDRAGPPIARVHHAAVDSRRRLADRDRDGGSDFRRGQPLSRCAALRLLVRPHAQGAFVRQHAPSRAHLQARRPLPAHAAHPRRALGAACRQRRRAAGKTVDGLRQWALAVQGRSNHNKATCALANKLARICYATLRDHEPYGAARLNKKIARTAFALPA